MVCTYIFACISVAFLWYIQSNIYAPFEKLYPLCLIALQTCYVTLISYMFSNTKYYHSF